MKSVKIVAILMAAAFLIAGMAAVALSDQPTYTGASKCKPCHFKEHKSWSETKMAKSFDALAAGVAADAKKKAGLDPAKDYSTDPKCLKCHTVGYGQPGGFTTAAATPDLKGVGCESCHGPGSAYSEVMRKNKDYKKAEVVAAGLISPPTEAQCLKCHNTESPFVGKDYKFDFAARKTQGTHEHFPLKSTH